MRMHADSESAGKRMQELIGSNFDDLSAESTEDHSYINTPKRAAAPAPGEVGYVNQSAGRRYENSSERETTMPAAEKAIITQWFNLSKVRCVIMRPDPPALPKLPAFPRLPRPPAPRSFGSL